MSDATLTVTQSLDTLSITTIAGSSLAGGGTVTGPLNIGVDDAGHDVKFFGDTASRYMLWDSSDDSLELSDNAKIKLGADGDLQLYHDGSQSRISDTGTGRLTIETDGDSIRLTKGTSENMAIFTPDGSVDLYYNNVKKFETTNLGATITGKLAVNGDLDVSGTTTTFSSSSVSVADPVFTLGGVSAPSSDDNKDRGIEFHYYDSSAKKGFFGYDDSTSSFVFLTAATNNSEVFTGTAGNLVTGNITLGDGHVIGDDNFDNLALISSSGENIVVAAANDIYLNTDASGGGTGTNRVLINETAVTLTASILQLDSAYAIQWGNGNNRIFGSSGNNYIRFDTSGAEAARFDASGQLIVKDHIRLDDTFKIQWGGTNSRIDGSHANNYLRFFTNNTERLRIHGGGNITIGGTAGQAMLQLEGGDVRVDNTRSFLTETAGGGVISAVSMNSSDNLTFGDGNFVIDVTGTAERMRIDSAGNVGIGTTAPSALLHVKSTGNGEIEVERASGALINLQAQADKGVIGTDSNHQLDFKANSTVRMTILEDGKVGIGTTSPSHKLHVSAEADGDYVGRITNTEATAGANYGLKIDGGSNASDVALEVSSLAGTHLFEIRGDGNVGIGTTTPSQKLEVAGDIFINGGAAGGRSLQLQRTGATNPWKIVQGHTATNDLEILENQDTRFILKSGGNVGIGTTAPASKVHIENTAYDFDSSPEVGDFHLMLRDLDSSVAGDAISIGFAQSTDATTVGAKISFLTEASHSRGSLVFSTSSTSNVGDNAAERMRITSAGNVGIGTNSPASFLHVSKDNSNSGNQFCVADLEGTNAAVRTYTHGGDAQGLILNHYYAVGGSSNEYMRYADLVANVGNGAGTTMRFITKNAANTYSTVSIDNSGNLDLGDNQKIRLGASDDFQIYHTGTNTTMLDQGTGALVIASNNLKVLSANQAETLLEATEDGACELYFNGSKKFETTTDGILLSGNGYVDMPDNGRIRMGASYDFAIYHSSSDNKSVIEETGSGNLSIRGTNIELNNAANNKTYLLATDGGSVQLRHNDSTKFETSATGATMGGNLVMGANHLMFANGGRVRLGDSNDLDLYHDGSNSYIDNGTVGDLFIRNNGENSVIIGHNANKGLMYIPDGRVELRFNDSKKFETTADGVTITGDALVEDNLYLTDAGTVRGKIQLNSSDRDNLDIKAISLGSLMRFYTVDTLALTLDASQTATFAGDVVVTGGLTINGTTTTIDTANLTVEDKNIIIGNVSSPSDTTADGGGITLKGASDYTIAWTNSTDSWTFNQGIEIDVGSTNAKGIKIGNDSYDASIIPTSLGGVAVSSSDPFLFYLNGAIRATFTTDGKLHIPDGGDLALGTGQDLKIGHDGTNGTVSITDGDLRFIQYQDNKMIRFYNDNGTGGTTEYLRIDGSAERVAFERTAHFNDSIQAAFGAGHDLKIYHDGDNSHIKNTNNHLYITNDADDKDIIFRCDDGSGGVVEYFRLDGGATASGFTQTIFPDNSLLLLGDDGDLLMYHNGSQSEIRNSTGDLLIVNRAADKDIIFQSDDGSGGEETYFYLDGSSSSGAPFTVFPDESYLAFGSSLDFTIRHNGTDTYISNDTGDLYIRSDANDKDIIFQSDDGSGGIETYFYLDGDGRQTVFNRPTQHTDGDYAYFGTGFDLKIWHDGTNSNIQNLTGALIISNNADDDDIIFQCDNGEGGVATYFRLDGSFGGAGYPTTLFPNDSSLRFGNSGNLQIINNGTDSYIQENNGDLYIRQSTDDKDIIFQSDDTSGGVATYMIIDGSQSAIRMKRKVKWDDNINATFGDGEDLKIYHEGVGNSSRIENETGPLYITNKANDADIYFQSDDGSGGVSTYFYLDGSSAGGGNTFTKWGDNDFISLGDGSDLYIYHNGTDSYLANGTGDFYITNGSDDNDIIFQCDDGSGGKETYFFLDGSLSGGNPYTTFPDNSNLTFGTGSDLTIVHDGNNSYIWSNGTGDLYIQQYNDDKDIVFQCDDGSGGLAEYFRLDGSGAPHPRTVFPDNSTLQFGGVGEGLQIFNDSADTYIQENTRHLYIKANAADAGIKFFADNGSGTATEYFRLDGSNVRSKFTKPVLMSSGQQIYQNSTDTYLTHDGTNYYFVNGTGDITIQSDTADGDIKFKADSGNGSSTTEYFRVDGGEERTVFTKHTIHPDGAQAYFGSGADLRMYHNGTDSHIDNYTGNLNIVNNTNDGDINFYCDDGSGSVEVYFYLDGSLSGGNPYTVFPDNSRLGIGTSADLYFNHDGTDSHINNTEGNLYITNFANDKDIIFKSDDGSGGTTEYFYLDGSAGNILFGKELRLLDGVQIQLGTGNDMQISHNGAIGTIQNTTGDLQLKTLADNSDMIFYSDDGSGSVAMYLSLDGGREIVRHHRGVEYNTVLSNNSDYTVGSADHVILMHGMNAGRTVNIPAAQCNSGRVLIVKDRDGTAATHNITIATGGSETIDGGATHTMSTNRGSVTLISDGSNWFII